jgi:hypothetical protein
VGEGGHDGLFCEDIFLEQHFKEQSKILLKINALQRLLQNTPLFSWNITLLRPTFAVHFNFISPG